MKHKLGTFLLIFIMIIFTVSKSGVVAYGQSGVQADWNGMTDDEKNTIIEEIIEECDKNGNANDADGNVHVNEYDNEEVNALIGKSQEEVEKLISDAYAGNAADNTTINGVITDPIEYLHNNVGKKTDVYSCREFKISGVSTTTMSYLKANASNCTLTSLYNILKYYSKMGYSKISTDVKKLYGIIEKEAYDLKYTDKKGLSYYYNDNLVVNTLEKIGYNATSKNNYLWTNKNVMETLNARKPFMLSLATGIYSNHTITVFGYREYTNQRTNERYIFLTVADGWSILPRYLLYTDVNYVGCMTSVNLPNFK